MWSNTDTTITQLCYVSYTQSVPSLFSGVVSISIKSLCREFLMLQVFWTRISPLGAFLPHIELHKSLNTGFDSVGITAGLLEQLVVQEEVFLPLEQLQD